MDQSCTPIFTALKHKKETFSYHVPGHKKGRVFHKSSAPFFREMLQLDATEIDGLDDLHDPQGVIKEAETLLSSLYGSSSSCFLTGGSTSGSLALLLAYGAGAKIMVQRNSHQSIFHGLELAGADPVFLHPETDSVSGLALGISPGKLERALCEHPDTKAVFLTSPTYEGYVRPLNQHAEICRARGVLLFVDEAHGAHFLPAGRPSFPEGALSSGADAVVQSAHKTLPAMTMGSWLHLGERIDEAAVRRILGMIQSSSPSYPIMASLDTARAYAAEKKDWRETAETIRFYRKLLEEKVPLLPEKIGPYNLDPLKVSLYAEKEGLPEKWQELMKNNNMYPELISPVHLLIVLSLEEKETAEAMKQLLSIFPRETFSKREHRIVEEKGMSVPVYSYKEMSKRRICSLSWKKSEGMVAAETIIPYPPGIPLLLRGERIHSRHLQERSRMLAEGVRIKGGGDKIKVFEPGEETSP